MLVNIIGGHGGVSPGFKATSYLIDNKLLIVASALVESVMARAQVEDFQVNATCVGSQLENLELTHPFYAKTVPVVLGDHVTTEAGTGAVHTAPGHGLDDYIVGQRYGLASYNPVDARGVFLPDTELLAGEHVSKVNEKIIEILKQHNNLLHVEKITHSYPHCWRHKTPIIFRATPQWFINMQQANLLNKAKTEVEKVQWVPKWGKARIESMLNDRPDWCISRQRTWGVPIPLFVHTQTHELHPNTQDLLENIATQVEKQGIDAWFDLDSREWIGDDADDYEKVTDTLDVWFDSGVTHACVLEKNPNLTLPADLYLEGSDQHRGWFQSSLLTSVAMREQAPYKTVLTHGFTVDAQGRKMSKSLGNVVAPQKVMKALGADILRLWVAAADYRAEMTVSDEILTRMSDAYRRIRNTARFLLANLHDFDPEKNSVPHDDLLALDQFMLSQTVKLQQSIQTAYDHFEFHLVYQQVHNFCVNDLGGFYLDIIKDRQYTMQTNSVGRRSAQTVIFHIAESLVRWVAPILSFTAEEIWQHLPGERTDSIFLTTYYDALSSGIEQSITAEEWRKIITAKIAVNKALESARNAGSIGSSLAADVVLFCDDELLTILQKIADELRFVLITSTATLQPIQSADQTTLATDMPGLQLLVSASAAVKCERCWHHCADLGMDSEHPTLCLRCVSNIDGDGEIRKIV